MRKLLLVFALLFCFAFPAISSRVIVPAKSVDSYSTGGEINVVNDVDTFNKDQATGDYARFDTVFTVPVVITPEHHEAHEGDHYFVKTFLVDTGGTGSTTYFSFTTPDTTTRIHAKTKIAPDVDTEVNIYEDATVAGGTPVVGINNDRDSLNVAGLSILSAPTVSVAGTVIWSARTGGGRAPVGVAPASTYEIIAKRNSTYVFELIKRTTADLVVDVDFWWYEHAPDN